MSDIPQISTHQALTIKENMSRFCKRMGLPQDQIETSAFRSLRDNKLDLTSWPGASSEREAREIEDQLNNPPQVPPTGGAIPHIYWTRAYLAWKLRQQGHSPA